MTRSRPVTFILTPAVVAISALAVAACGGGSAATGSPGPPSSTSRQATSKPPPAAVRVANSSLGRILVDAQGRTLYLFKADVGTKSACTGECATAWPPLVATGKPTAGSGAKPSLVGATTRSDGSRQVTYHGHPLYLFIKDTKPGQTTGEGVVAFGAAWFVLSPAGNQISPKHSGHPSTRAAGKPAPKPAAKRAPTPAVTQTQTPTQTQTQTQAPTQTAPPVAKPQPPANNGIPQNNGGDGDSDNNGAPSDGDGGV